MFAMFPRYIQHRARLKDPVFLALWYIFFEKKELSLKGSATIFSEFCVRMDVEKSQNLSVFLRHCEAFFQKQFH